MAAVAVLARHRRVLRLALGTTLSFVTAEMLDWELSFVGATSLAPLYVTALVTFVIVLGMGVAPFLDQPEATLAIRLRNLAIACVYAFAALRLVGHAGRPSVAGETRDA